MVPPGELPQGKPGLHEFPGPVPPPPGKLARAERVAMAVAAFLKMRTAYRNKVPLSIPSEAMGAFL